MKLFGIGTDIVDIERIKRSLKKNHLLKGYLVKRKQPSVKKQKNLLIVSQKDLPQKKLLLRHQAQEFLKVSALKRLLYLMRKMVNLL